MHINKAPIKYAASLKLHNPVHGKVFDLLIRPPMLNIV